MPNPDWLKIKEIFYQTLELPEAEREEFLSGQDEFVRAEVKSLIASHKKAEKFIAEPAVIEFGLNGETFLGRKIENYTLLEIIGTGGMGKVFLAEKDGFEKKFAVKLIKRGMDTDEVLRRFELERRILARLEHPNIVPLLDGGMTGDGLPFLVMEYVEGVPVTRFCATHQLSVEERLKLFRQICSAVGYAHQNLIIHRDLKPANILVTKSGVPKLLDFGIAKLLDPDEFEDTATTMRARRFTPEYASPEQLNGLPITTASDVYSLGVILYELLSGQRPFQTNSRNYQVIVRQILTEEPVRPSFVVSRPLPVDDKTKRGGQTTTENEPIRQSPIVNRQSLSGDLDNIILKALRKEPERRYESVQEFSEDIRRHLEGFPVTAMTDTRLYRFSKFVRRHKTGVMVGVFISLLIFSISAIAVRQSIIATREREKSEKRLNEIREVAKSLMNEINDSLGKIPGNVTVQKALSEKSVILLDNLASDETNDPALLSELAEAYTKLAKIQNLSLREFDKSIENLIKAKTIYKKILQTEPGNVKIRRNLYDTLMRLTESFRATKRREEWFQIEIEAFKNQQELINLQPQNPTHLGTLAAIYGGFAEVNMSFGKDNEVGQYRSKGIEIIDRTIEMQKAQGESPKSLAETARFYFIKGWLLESLGEKEKAIENYQTTADLAMRAFLEDAALTDNFLRIVGAHEKIGRIYESENQFQAAQEIYFKGKGLVNTELKNKSLSDSANLRAYECILLVKGAKMLDKSGNGKQAREYFADGENLCRKILNENPNLNGLLLQQIESFYEIGNFYFAGGERERSITLLLEISKRLEMILEKNEWDWKTAFALADTFEKIGDFQTDEQARKFYEKSYQIWTRYQQIYPLLPSEIEKMQTVEKKLQNN